MTKLPYREGTWFAVPLRQPGYAVGLVARMRPRGRIVLAYLFGPRRDQVPNLMEIDGLQPKDAIRCWQLGDLGLVKGKWPIIGETEHWRREVWPTPTFVRRNELARSAWRVTYSDADPSEVILEEPVSFDIEGLEPDSLYGAGAVELRMTKLLIA